MSFHPSAFYTVADDLRLKASTDGGHLRTLISRAYYGALIVARDHKRISTRERDGHQRVINAYKGNDASEDMVADALSKLRTLRERADYQPRYNLTSGDGLQALAHCKRVLSTLQALPGTTPPPSPTGNTSTP